MANNSSSDSGIWNIIWIILFIVFAYISTQTPSSKAQYEHDNGKWIHVGGNN